MTEKERFEEMERIIGDYDFIMGKLVESRHAYETFFSGIAQIVEQGIAEQLAYVRTAEEKRRALVEEAIRAGDSDLLQMATAREEDLRTIVRALGQSALLVFKKIDIHRTAFERLIEDQKIQRKVLSNLEQKLKAYQRMYELDEEIARLKENVHSVVNVALNFEKNLRNHLGPVQVLLEKVLQADNELHKAVVEIQMLAHIMSSETIHPDRLPDLDERDRSLLNFLIRSQIKRSRLEEALKESLLENQSFVDEAWPPEEEHTQQGNVSDAVNNVLWFLEAQLNRLPEPDAYHPARPGERLDAAPAEIPMPDGDDFTIIEGIGMDMKHRLHTAGILFFEQLARASSIDIRQALGKMAESGGRTASSRQIENWILQARRLGRQ